MFRFKYSNFPVCYIEADIWKGNFYIPDIEAGIWDRKVSIEKSQSFFPKQECFYPDIAICPFGTAILLSEIAKLLFNHVVFDILNRNFPVPSGNFLIKNSNPGIRDIKIAIPDSKFLV